MIKMVSKTYINKLAQIKQDLIIFRVHNLPNNILSINQFIKNIGGQLTFKRREIGFNTANNPVTLKDSLVKL